MTSLWPDLSGAVTTPISIVREQAQHFRDAVQQKLTADVEVQNQSGVLLASMIIKKPGVDGFRKRIFRFEQGINPLYPTTIKAGGQDYICNDETEFIANLTTVITSQRVINIVTQILNSL